MCGVFSWIIQSIFPNCSPNCITPHFTSEQLATFQMDPELFALVDEHRLGHKKEVFTQMGIKTFKQMATIKISDLKENHLFNYADERAFQTFREICIQKVEQKVIHAQHSYSTEPVLSPPIVTETGIARIPEDSAPQQVASNPPNIAPLYMHQHASLPNFPTHPQYMYSPRTLPTHTGGYCSIAPVESFASFRQGLQPHSLVGVDQYYYSPNYPQHSIRPELRQQFDQQRQGVYQDNMQLKAEPNIQFRDYQINSSDAMPRGIGLIFTNETFVNHERREGAQNDEHNFSLFFRMMGLEVRRYPDYTSQEILDTLAQVAMGDLSNTEMFAVAFSTHGDQGDYLYGRDNTSFSLYKQVISLFRINNCPTLKGKPKLFFVQACRGDKTDATVKPPGIRCDSAERACVTLETDFLIAHSSVEGFKAFRHEKHGSWFVTQLKRAFEMFGDECSLLEVLSLTNQLVVEQSIISSGATDKYIQSCQSESTLTKLLRIKPVRLM